MTYNLSALLLLPAGDLEIRVRVHIYIYEYVIVIRN